MVGQEVWEEWTGQVVEVTGWREGAKDEWGAKERAIYCAGVGSGAWTEIRNIIQ